MQRALAVSLLIAAFQFAPTDFCTGFGVASAWANDKVKARQAYSSASKHYDLGEFAEALTDFKEAYRNFEEPSFLYNIGQCHRQLGQAELAVRFFRTYLGKMPNAPNRALVEDMIGKLERELQQRQPPTQAPTPTPPPSEPAATPTPAPAATPPPSAPAATVAAHNEPALVATAPARRVPVYKKWWLWTTVGVVAVVGVGVGVGVAFGVRRDASGPATTIPTQTPEFQ